MNPILIGLAILIVILSIRIMIQRAPKNGKPLLLRLVVILLVLVFVGLLLRGLIPLAFSVLGGLALYSRPILQAFGFWRSLSQQSHQQTNAPTGNQAMSVQQARDILGVGPQASRAEIIQTHKQMMARNHPDKGGSDYLAQQINAARDRLLQQPDLKT